MERGGEGSVSFNLLRGDWSLGTFCLKSTRVELLPRSGEGLVCMLGPQMLYKMSASTGF